MSTCGFLHTPVSLGSDGDTDGPADRKATLTVPGSGYSPGLLMPAGGHLIRVMRVHLIAPNHGHMDLTSAPDVPPGRVAVVTGGASGPADRAACQTGLV